MSTTTSDTWSTIHLLINSHFLNALGIDSADDVGEVRSTPARQLLSPLRFDIFAKHIYATFWKEKLDSTWGRDLYAQHLRALNCFDEGDGSGKSGLNAFLKAFHDVLGSIANDGFMESKSLVPVTRAGMVIDGSHRVAAAVRHDKNVSVVELNSSGFAFDYHFFQRRGMPPRYMDAVALEFCRLRTDAYVALVFPSAVGHHDRVVEILNAYGQVFYEKQLLLNRQGGVNLVRQIYENQPWIGDETNQFAGAWNKAEACFALKGPLRVFVFSADSLADVNRAKGEIRHVFQVQNHSIHINDSHDEAIAIARMVMNDNSIEFLNKAAARSLPRFDRYFASFRQWLISRNLPSDSFCVDGSAVLGAYGIREPDDFDFLHHGHEGIATDIPNVTSHNDEVNYHAFTIDDLIFNPQNHFYRNGIKFVSLEALRKMKMKRGEPKDMNDLRLMAPFLKTSRQMVLSKMAYEFDRNLRRVKNRVREKTSKGMDLVRRSQSVLSRRNNGD